MQYPKTLKINCVLVRKWGLISKFKTLFFSNNGLLSMNKTGK
jgi:hypothetical protein